MLLIFFLPVFYAQKENKYIKNIASINILIVYIHIVYLFYIHIVYYFDSSESEKLINFEFIVFGSTKYLPDK